MGVQYSELDFNMLARDLTDCCLGEETCLECNKSSCVIEYARSSTKNCEKEKISYVMDGEKNIPTTDLKIYNEEELAKGIAHTLKMCRSCEADHYGNCIISVIRNCYEIGLFGETQSYDGSTFLYLNRINDQDSEIANDIISEYNKVVKRS